MLYHHVLPFRYLLTLLLVYLHRLASSRSALFLLHFLQVVVQHIHLSILHQQVANVFTEYSTLILNIYQVSTILLVLLHLIYHLAKLTIHLIIILYL